MTRFPILLRGADEETRPTLRGGGGVPARVHLPLFRPADLLRCGCGALLVAHGHMDVGPVAGRLAIRLRLIHPLPLCATPQCTSPGLPRSAVVEIIPAQPVLGGGRTRAGGQAQISTTAVVPRR